MSELIEELADVVCQMASEMQMKKEAVLITGISLVLCLLLCTCSPSPTPTSEPTPALSATPTSSSVPPVVQRVIVWPPSQEIYDDESEALTCVAIDPEGYSITGYTWQAAGGTILGEGATVVWAPPDIGEVTDFTVSVQALNSEGALSPSEHVTITVRDAGSATIPQGPGNRPVIDAVVAEWSYIERGRTGLIVCNAHDPDGDKLTYTWQTDRGSISGQGPVVTYTAPLNYVDVRVTVTVTDSRGRMDSAGASFSVVCCDAANMNPEWFGIH